MAFIKSKTDNKITWLSVQKSQGGQPKPPLETARSKKNKGVIGRATAAIPEEKYASNSQSGDVNKPVTQIDN
jgi:hypothetical protein